jgi:hypothetical protein
VRCYHSCSQLGRMRSRHIPIRSYFRSRATLDHSNRALGLVVRERLANMD